MEGFFSQSKSEKNLLDENVPVVVEIVEEEDNAELLMNWRKLEADGKARKGVLDAIDERLDQLLGVSESSEEEVNEEVKPDLEEAEPAGLGFASFESSSRVDVVSRWPARLVVRAGQTPSGERYVWDKAGAVVNVNTLDVDFLMSKNAYDAQDSCCGGGPRIYFELA